MDHVIISAQGLFKCVSVKEMDWSHALLTKAMECELPALPNAPNIGLIITYKIEFPSLVEAFLFRWIKVIESVI